MSIVYKWMERLGIKLKDTYSLELKSPYIVMKSCAWCGKKRNIYWEQRCTTNLENVTLPGLIICTACAENEAEARDLIEYIVHTR